MINSYIFQRDIGKKYAEDFNDYALNILYGGNILIGSEIEEEYKNKPLDD